MIDFIGTLFNFVTLTLMLQDTLLMFFGSSSPRLQQHFPMTIVQCECFVHRSILLIC